MPASARSAPSIRAAAGPASTGTASVPAPPSLPGGLPVRNGTTATRAGPASATTGCGGPGRGQAASATRAVATASWRVIAHLFYTGEGSAGKSIPPGGWGGGGGNRRPPAARLARGVPVIVGFAGGTPRGRESGGWG